MARKRTRVRKPGMGTATFSDDKRRAPELDAGSAARRNFMADSVYGSNIDAIGNGVTALHCAPCLTLGIPVLLFFMGMPSYCSGIEKNGCTLHCCQSCSFGIPLVPANQRPDVSRRCRERSESEIPRREVEFFIIRRVVGDMHFPVHACDTSVRVDDNQAVVVHPGRAALEHRGDKNDVQPRRQRGEELGRRTRDAFGEVERPYIFLLAEVP